MFKYCLVGQDYIQCDFLFLEEVPAQWYSNKRQVVEFLNYKSNSPILIWIQDILNNKS